MLEVEEPGAKEERGAETAPTLAPEVLPSQEELEKEGGSPPAGPPPQELVEEVSCAPPPAVLDKGTEGGSDEVCPPPETSAVEEMETETAPVQEKVSGLGWEASLGGESGGGARLAEVRGLQLLVLGKGCVQVCPTPV